MITYLDYKVGDMLKYHDRMSGLVLDLGGGLETCSMATHVIDLTEPSRGIWIKADLCDPDVYRQFGDKQFDWVYCNHTLEDVYNPFIILREAQRIAKRGLFGMPSWGREVVKQSDREDWEHISGWPHHFWLIGKNKTTGTLEFYPKLSWIVQGEHEYHMDNINFEWDGADLPFANIYWEYWGKSLRKDLLAWLGARWEI